MLNIILSTVMFCGVSSIGSNSTQIFQKVKIELPHKMLQQQTFL
jgi:hypothetical protein